MHIKNPLLLLALAIALLASPTPAAHAQKILSALTKGLSLDGGAQVSGFNPGYGPNELAGFGVWADLNGAHGLGLETECRWLRLNESQRISQDHYLAGVRYRFRTFRRATPYLKMLAGIAAMNLQDNLATGRFTDLAYGGGVDFHLTRHLAIRAIDVEIQQIPQFVVNSIQPVGVSAGISYRIF